MVQTLNPWGKSSGVNPREALPEADELQDDDDDDDNPDDIEDTVVHSELVSCYIRWVRLACASSCAFRRNFLSATDFSSSPR